MREMDDLILCLVWSHPKVVNHCGILLAGAGSAWQNVDGSSISCPGWGTDGCGQPRFHSAERGGTEQCSYRKPGRTVPVSCLSWRICPQKVPHCMFHSTRQWESSKELVQLVRLCPQGTSQAFLYPPRRTYFLFFRSSTPQSPTPPTSLSKQPPPFQMLMLFSWLNCGPDHELGVNQYSLSMLIYTHWKFPFLHHLAELYDTSFISPRSLACHSPFLAPEPPALLWTPCRFGI